MDKKEKQDLEHPRELRGKKASVTDDVEEAQEKSGTMDEWTADDPIIERPNAVPEGRPIPAAHQFPTPAGGATVGPRAMGDRDEAEQALEVEQQAKRTPRRPG